MNASRESSRACSDLPLACQQRQAQGFSLIELAFVAMMIAILFALMLPALSRSRREESRLAELSDAQQAAIRALTDAGIDAHVMYDETIVVRAHRAPMTRALFEHVVLLDQISQLALNGAGLSDTDLQQLQPSETLVQLNLKGNDLSDAGLSHLTSFPRLNTLALDWNPLAGAGLAAVGQLAELQNLTLSCTELTGGLRHLAGNTNLQTLDLSRTGIDDEALGQLPALPQLRFLDLSGTPVTSKGIAALRPMASLSGLSLDETLICDEVVAALARFPNLTQLSMAGTNLTGATFEALGELPALSQLTLDETAVTDQAVAHLEKCLKLTIFSAQRTNLSDAALPSLVRLPELRNSHLRHTRITRAGLRDFLEQRPLVGTDWSPPHPDAKRNAGE